MLRHQTGTRPAFGVVSGDVQCFSGQTTPGPIPDTTAAYPNECERQKLAYIGNDIRIIISRSAKRCSEACHELSGCRHFTFESLFKKCFLKSGRGLPKRLPGFISGDMDCYYPGLVTTELPPYTLFPTTPTTPTILIPTIPTIPTIPIPTIPTIPTIDPIPDTTAAYPNECERQKLAYIGNDIRIIISRSAKRCSEACHELSGCRHFTFESLFKKCFLKSGRGLPKRLPGFISGDMDCYYPGLVTTELPPYTLFSTTPIPIPTISIPSVSTHRTYPTYPIDPPICEGVGCGQRL